MGRLRTRVVDDVVRHAQADRPDECCGILIGTRDLVEDARPAHNIAERPNARFVIDPADHFNAQREARRRGIDVVGFYHSHPRSAAVPSDIDRAEASYPDHLYLIVGLADNRADVRLFRFLDGIFHEVPFLTVG
jgi:proteasome lid subunit RPN8/RPN11